MIAPLLGLLLACSPASKPESTDPKQGDTLVVALPFDPGNANPLVTPYALSFWITDLVSPGLVKRTLGPDGLTFEPALAESWSFAEDGSSLTYKLRTDATWSDGQPVTATDVVHSWSMTSDPAVASNWYGDTRFVDRVVAVNDHEVRWEFKTQTNPVLLQNATIRGLLPEHVFKDVDRATLRGHSSARKPVGAGPFQVAKWDPSERIVLEPNPHAPWKPHLDRIVFRVLPEYQTRLLEFERGKIDVLPTVELADRKRLEDAPGSTVVRSEKESMQYVGYNLTKPLFQDVAVRRALTQAIHTEGLIKALRTSDGEAFASPCVGTVSPLAGPWFQPIEPLAFDPQAAADALEAAGWKLEGNQRTKDGVVLAFPLMIQTGEADLKRIGVLVQSMLHDVGVQITLDMVEPTRFSNLARDRDYQAILWSFGANPAVNPEIQWHSTGKYNWMGVNEPAIDAAIEAGLKTTDRAVSQAKFREVQRLVYDLQPATFLFWSDELIAVSSRFEEASPDTWTALRHAERWWVKPENRRY